MHLDPETVVYALVVEPVLADRAAARVGLRQLVLAGQIVEYVGHLRRRRGARGDDEHLARIRLVIDGEDLAVGVRRPLLDCVVAIRDLARLAPTAASAADRSDEASVWLPPGVVVVRSTCPEPVASVAVTLSTASPRAVAVTL